MRPWRTCGPLYCSGLRGCGLLKQDIAFAQGADVNRKLILGRPGMSGRRREKRQGCQQKEKKQAAQHQSEADGMFSKRDFQRPHIASTPGPPGFAAQTKGGVRCICAQPGGLFLKHALSAPASPEPVTGADEPTRAYK